MFRHLILLAGAMLTATYLCAAPPSGFIQQGENWTLPWGKSSLQGILIAPPESTPKPRPAVILSHGLGGTAEGLRGRAEKFAQAGYVVIAVNYAHSGPGQMANPDNAASPENIRRAKACLDILAARPDVDATRLYAWGYSMGAILTVGLAAEHPELLAAAAILAGGIQENPERLYISAERAHRIRTPFLILHGGADPRVLPEWSALLAEVLQEVHTPYERYVYPGVDHSGITRTADAADRILPWFARYPMKAPVSERPRGAREPEESMPGESYITPRNGVEYLSYQTADGIAELEALLAADATTPLAPGDLQVRYFRSAVDGSVQPYALWLPSAFDPTESYNLLVQLHGIGPKTLAGRRQTWTGMNIEPWIDQTSPTVVIQCYGRGNTFYQGIGETDILEAIADARQRVRIADQQVFIMGHSMGGAGSWMIGLHYPDRFGSITPIDPAMGLDDELAQTENLPAWMRPQTVMFFQENLFPNARNIPVYLKNAGAGIQQESTVFTDGIIAAGGFSTTEFFPGMPHYWAPKLSHAMFTGQATMLPAVTQPPEVKFMTNTLRYNRAYWVTIDQLAAPATVASITATYDNGLPAEAPRGPMARRRPPPAPTPPQLTITTENISALTLRLQDAGIPADAMPPLTIDGLVIPASALSPTTHLQRTAGNWAVSPHSLPPAGRKHHGMQGPVGDALMGPFLAVYGDAPEDRALAIAELDAVRNPATRLVVHGDFPLKPASAVTAEDIATKNLLLFGSIQSHALLRRYAPRLPAALVNHADSVFIYPNPENPARYIVVWGTAVLSLPNSPLRAGYVQPVNLLPDYVKVSDGKITDAGHFTNQWTLPSKL